jgi:hypothetical protein
MLPDTTDRVSEHTSDCVNQQIRDQLERSIEHHRGMPHAMIEQRLKQLDQEWDIERAIEANASTLALIGLGLGATVNKKFFILPGVITAFLLQHALQGWCPPIPVLRRLGFRTQFEIEQERYALKALRGDFADISELSSVDAILAATE